MIMSICAFPCFNQWDAFADFNSLDLGVLTKPFQEARYPPFQPSSVIEEQLSFGSRNDIITSRCPFVRFYPSRQEINDVSVLSPNCRSKFIDWIKTRNHIHFTFYKLIGSRAPAASQYDYK
ncbi:hypothetical protein D3C72_800000 [compost metagenome]